jgi:hypothetical protein
MILGASGGGLLYPLVGFHGLLQLGAVLCVFGVLALLRDRVTMQLPSPSRQSAVQVDSLGGGS